MSLPPQAWTGERRPTPERFKAPSERMPGGWKKPGGGLWTATYDDRRLSAWCQWCLGEEYRVTRKQPVFPIWLLDPDPGARVFVIDAAKDLETLVADYPSKKPVSDLDSFSDWTAVARDYDAVHLTSDGQWATRFSHPHNLYGWDCESTLWLRWAFSRVTFRGLVWVPYDDIWEEEDAG